VTAIKKKDQGLQYFILFTNNLLAQFGKVEIRISFTLYLLKMFRNQQIKAHHLPKRSNNQKHSLKADQIGKICLLASFKNNQRANPQASPQNTKKINQK